MYTTEKERRQFLNERGRTTGTEDWYTPHVAEEDKFIEGDMDISQIWFSKKTAADLVRIFDTYAKPCCLCTPRLAWEWFDQKRLVTLLDIDKRVARFSNFIHYNIAELNPIELDFNVLIGDPPVFEPKFIFDVIDALVGDRRPDIFLVFRADQEAEIVQVFAKHRLQLIDYDLHHVHVKPEYHPLFRLYGNHPALFTTP